MSVADTADILFGLPILFYGYLLCMDAYNALGKHKKMPSWLEPLLFVILGIILLFSSFGKLMVCKNAACTNDATVPLLFGILMMMLGAVHLLNQNLSIFSFSVSWVTPVVLAIIALLYFPNAIVSLSPSSGGGGGGHSHGHRRSLFSGGHGHGGGHGGGGNSNGEMPMSEMDGFSTMLQQTFAISSLSAAALRGLMLVDPPRWGIFTAYALSLSSLSLIFQSPALSSSLSLYFSSHTVVLGITVVGVILLVPLMVLIYSYTKNDIHNHNYDHLSSSSNSVAEKDTKGS